MRGRSPDNQTAQPGGSHIIPIHIPLATRLPRGLGNVFPGWAAGCLCLSKVAMDDSIALVLFPRGAPCPLSGSLDDVMLGSGERGGRSSLRKGSQCYSPYFSGEGNVLGCFKPIVFGTFCVCRAANSGAICLCSQHQSPGINSFLP